MNAATRHIGWVIRLKSGSVTVVPYTEADKGYVPVGAETGAAHKLYGSAQAQELLRAARPVEGEETQ